MGVSFCCMLASDRTWGVFLGFFFWLRLLGCFWRLLLALRLGWSCSGMSEAEADWIVCMVAGAGMSRVRLDALDPLSSTSLL